MKIDNFDTWDTLEAYLKVKGTLLKASDPGMPGENAPLGYPVAAGALQTLNLAVPADSWRMSTGTHTDGLMPGPPISVSAELFAKMETDFGDENSRVRRFSTRPITRAFVYLDISDFSKMPTGVQLLVVLALSRIASEEQARMGYAEAQLCIGDGYIYVWDTPVGAARFAANLAIQIEREVTNGAPEFHFRIGVHIGPVRCFWDEGRKGFNYVGDGINGGNRVLAAIGKDTDDVVYFSGELRTAIQKSGNSGALLHHLHNKGRREDKHKRHWRVYELNHSGEVAF